MSRLTPEEHEKALGCYAQAEALVAILQAQESLPDDDGEGLVAEFSSQIQGYGFHLYTLGGSEWKGLLRQAPELFVEKDTLEGNVDYQERKTEYSKNEYKKLRLLTKPVLEAWTQSNYEQYQKLIQITQEVYHDTVEKRL